MVSRATPTCRQTGSPSSYRPPPTKADASGRAIRATVAPRLLRRGWFLEQLPLERQHLVAAQHQRPACAGHLARLAFCQGIGTSRGAAPSATSAVADGGLVDPRGLTTPPPRRGAACLPDGQMQMQEQAACGYPCERRPKTRGTDRGQISHRARCWHVPTMLASFQPRYPRVNDCCARLWMLWIVDGKPAFVPI